MTVTAALPLAPRWSFRRIDREQYVTGLRALADALDRDPSLEMPLAGSSESSGLTVALAADQTDELRAWLQALTDLCEATSEVCREIHGRLGGLHVTLLISKAVA